MSAEAPKLRDDLIVTEREERGQKVFVIKNPETSRFFQVGEAEYAIMRLMNGERTIEEIRAECAGAHQMDVEKALLESFALQLGSAGCLELIERGHQAAFIAPKQAAWGMRVLGNILYWRVAAVNPDRFITWVAPQVSFLFTPLFVATALFAFAFGITVLWLDWPTFAHEAGVLGSLKGLILLWLAVGVTICLHEMAHGVTCKHFGGRVPEMGFLMILLTFPCFFTNVSDAWLFRKRSQRLWVTAAGVFFEGFLWSLWVFVWRLTAPESTLHQMALAAVAASGTGMLFSLNPLIKFDGYYFLSDLLEIPNLRQRSFAHLGRWLWQLITGAPVVNMMIPAPMRRIYTRYGLLALAYTILILVGISTMIGGFLWRYFGGVGAAVFVLLLYLFMRTPIAKLVGGIHAMAKQTGFWRRPRVLIVGGLLVAAAVVGCFVEMELKISGSFVLEPAEAREISARIDSYVTAVHKREGERVAEGDLLLELDRSKVESLLESHRASLRQAKEELKQAERGPRQEEVAQAQSRVAVAEQELRNAEEDLKREESLRESPAFDPAKAAAARQRRDLADRRLDSARKDLEVTLAGKSAEEIEQAKAAVEGLRAQVRQAEDDLKQTEIHAPIAGVLVTARPERLLGTHVQPGTALLSIQEVGTLDVDINVPEKELAEIRIGQPVELKVLGYPDLTYTAQVVEIAPVVTSTNEQLAAATHMVVRCRMSDPDGMLKPGMTGEARIACGQRTLMSLFTRRLRRWVKVEFWW